MTSPKQPDTQQNNQGEKMPERGTAEAAPREQDTPDTPTKASGKGASSEGTEPIQEQNRNSSKV